MKVTNEKNVYCHNCKRYFHYLGIMRHRAKHRKNKENVMITFTHGDTYKYTYAGAKE